MPHPMKMKKKETAASRFRPSNPITRLSNTIRGIIFNKLEQSEAYKLRLVCKQWNEDIKDFYNFGIKLNEDSPGLEFILQLRISRLKVIKLVQKRIRILPYPVTIPATEGRQLRERKTPQKLTFKHPECIRRIEINWSSNISPNDLKDLLQLCQDTVTYLHLSLNDKISKYRFPIRSPISFQFLNLKRLDLTFEFKAYVFRTHSIRSILENSQFPSISSLKLIFDNENCRYIPPESSESESESESKCEPKTGSPFSPVSFVLKLLTKNPTGMEQLSFSLRNFEDYDAKEVLTKLSGSERGSLKTVTNLKRIKFYVDFVPEFTKTDLGNLLLELIPRQGKLEAFYPGIGFECSPALLKSLILNNSETIVDVRIESLNVNSEVPFDISVVKNCHKLKRFYLKRNFEDLFPKVGSGPELINCACFPAALIDLSLQGFRILSRDLLTLLNSDLLPKLEKLCLYRCGDSGDCGVDSNVLEKIAGLETRKLMNIDLMGFNLSDSKMKAVMNRLGEMRNDPYIIRLVRDGDNPDTGFVNLDVLLASLRQDG